jgi:WhiB family transcriptional regulator, redox-sensing transcriptional regulator
MYAATTIQELEPDSPGTGLSLHSAPAWWAEARCNDGAGTLTALFFSDELQDIAAAKRICALCPAMADCLEGAIERREPWGVWGGQLFLNGRILMSKRRRGRPPKNPRPEDKLPDIPLPAHLVDRVELRSA